MNTTSHEQCTGGDARACSPRSHYYTNNKLVLNWDALQDVISHLSRGDASRMSRTCHALHQVAPRFLLDGGVDLMRNSFHYLRSLTLHIWEEWHRLPEFVDRLVELFSRSTELEFLDLFYVDFLDIDERIPRALEALNKLRSLKFANPTPRMLEMVKRMQAPLTHVDANFYDIELEDDPADPVPVFAHLNNSLTSMRAVCVQMQSMEMRYPCLTSLLLEGFKSTLLQPIIHCFPNLQDLRIYTRDDDFEDDPEPIRLENLASQAVTSWTSLNSLSSDTDVLYKLALQCRVQNVSIRDWCLSSENHSQRLCTIISDLHPTSLNFVVVIPEFSPAHLAVCLAAVRGSLTHLKLALRVYGDTYEDPTPNIIAMIETLSAFSLRSLSFEVTWMIGIPQQPFVVHVPEIQLNGDEEIPPPPSDPLTPSNQPHSADTTSVESIETNNLAEHAMRCIPTLCSFSIRILPYSRNSVDIVSYTNAKFEIVEEGDGLRRVVRASKPEQ